MDKQNDSNKFPVHSLPPYDYQRKNPGYPRTDIDVELQQVSHERVPLSPNVKDSGYQPVPTQQGSYYTNEPQGLGQQPSTAVVVMPTPLTNPPSTNLCYAIFTTICCCWMIGAFAIMKSVECGSAISAGNRRKAEVKSREASKMANVSLGIGIVLIIVIIVYQVLSIFVLKNNINRNY